MTASIADKSATLMFRVQQTQLDVLTPLNYYAMANEEHFVSTIIIFLLVVFLNNHITTISSTPCQTNKHTIMRENIQVKGEIMLCLYLCTCVYARVQV